MKKLLYISILLLICNNFSFSQIEFQLQAGAGINKLNFSGFESYLSTYNKQNSGSSMIDSAKFNQFGAGYHFGGKFRLGPFISGFNLGTITGFQSKATYAYDQSRSFVFKNSYFDLEVGGRIGKEKFAFIPYFTMTINSLNLHTFYTYGDVRSYGGEKNLTGIYTSWRLMSRLGGRFEYRFNRYVGVFADLSFTINKTEYLGGDFSESNSATDSKYFQSDASQDEYQASSDGLKEAYRLTRGVFGLQFTIGTNDED